MEEEGRATAGYRKEKMVSLQPSQQQHQQHQQQQQQQQQHLYCASGLLGWSPAAVVALPVLSEHVRK